MSFIFENFTSVGQKISSSPNVYSYETTDLLTTTRKTGYFIDDRLDLKPKDIIACSAIDAAITFSVVSINPIVLRKATGIDYAEFHLPVTPVTVLLNNDGVTYTKITTMVLSKGQGFVDNGDSSINKVNNDGRFVFNGTSDLKADKAVEITYALFINDIVQDDQKTIHTITASAKFANISITSVPDIPVGSKLDVRVKGDGTIGATVTINKLDVTLAEL